MAGLRRELEIIVKMSKSSGSDATMRSIKNSLGAVVDSFSNYNSMMIKNAKAVGAQSKVYKELAADLKKMQQAINAIDFDKLSNSKQIEKTNASIGKMIEGLRKASRELGNLPREGLGGIVTLQKKLLETVSALEVLRKASFLDLASIKLAAQETARLLAEIRELSSTGEKAFDVVNKLGEGLRKIQAIGSMKGTSLFSRDISSLQLYQKELEKLRMKLAEVNGEKFSSSSSGVTKRMIEDFNKFSKAIDESKIKITTLENSLKKMSSARETFMQLAQSIDFSDTAINKLGIDAVKTSSEFNKLARSEMTALGTGNEKAEQSLVVFRKMREAIVAVGKEAGRTLNFQSINTDTMIKEVDAMINHIRTSMKEGEVSVEKLEAAYKESINQMAAANQKMLSSGIDDAINKDKAALEAFAVVTERTEKSIQELNLKFAILQEINRATSSSFSSTASGIKMMNEVMEMATRLMETQSGSQRKLTGEILNRVAAMQKAGVAEYGLANHMTQTADQAKRLNQELNILKTATVGVTMAEVKYSKEIQINRQLVDLYFNSILKLNATLNELKNSGKGNSVAANDIRRSLKEMTLAANQAGLAVKETSAKLEQLTRRGADASRAMDRMSASGFANMIISQAAWMAGFQLIFGTLDRFKEALNQVTETQLAVARAMRTIRDETKTTAEMQDYLTDAVDKMRMKFGVGAEEVGEALYQLGSAGLHLKESLAALNSTMDNVIGTEADMENIVNLVAGLYNNFGDQIVKVDGKVTTITDSFKNYNNQLVETASLTEKFQKINDLLVRTFDAHQAEMIQIRDGMKFMSQSARAANVSLEEQLAILATLHDHLIKAGAAGRGMRVIFSRIAKDSQKFADAFDIKIDPTQPLNFMKILEDISDKMKDQIITVDKLGLIFKRMGLRGAEPFRVLITYFDELEKNLLDLKTSADGAAEAMRKTRLDNIGDQAKIAGAQIMVFLKNALTPLAEVMKTIIKIFMGAVDAIKAFNEATYGLLSGVTAIAGYTAAFGALLLVFTNLKSAGGWIFRVFVSLASSIGSLGSITARAGDQVNSATSNFSKFAKQLGQTTSVYKEASARTVLLNENMKIMTKTTGGMSPVLSGLGAAVKNVASAFWILKSAMLGIAVMAVIYGIIKLISYLASWRERTIEAVKVLKGQSIEIRVAIDAFKKMKEEIKGVSENSSTWREKLQRVGDILLVNIDNTNSYSESVKKLNNAIDDYVKIQEAAFEAKKIEILYKNFDLIRDSLKNVITETSLWKNILDSFNPASMWEKFASGWKQMINGFRGTGAVIRQQLIEVNDKISISREAIKQLDDALKNTKGLPLELVNNMRSYKKQLEEELPNLIKRGIYLKQQQEELGKTANVQEAANRSTEKAILLSDKKIDADLRLHTTLEEVRNGLLETYDGEYKLSEAQAKNLVTLEKEIKAYEAKKTAMEKSSDALAKVKSELESTETLLREQIVVLGDFEKAMKQTGDPIKDIGTYLLDMKGRLDELNKSKGINEFSAKVASLSNRLKALEGSGNTKAFNKILKELAELGKDGSKHLDEIFKRLEKLGTSIDKINGKKIEITLGMFSHDLEVSNTKLAIFKERIDALAAAGKKSGYEMEKAMQDYRKELEDVRKTLGESEAAQRKEADAAGNMASEYLKKSEAAGITEEKRIDLLEKAGVELGKEKTIIESLKGTLTARYENEKTLIAANLAAKKISASEADRLLKEAQDKYMKSFKETEGKLKDIDQLNLDIQSRLLNASVKEIESLEDLAKKVLAGITIIQETAKKGIQLNSDSIIEAWEVVENLRQELDKLRNDPIIINVKIAVDDSELKDKVPNYTSPYNGGLTKYNGGMIQKFASGGIVPAMVTHGEGYVPPNQAKGNLNYLNKLNHGGVSSNVPGGIGVFSGAKGVDKISTALPTGSYVISQKGMRAYSKSLNNGAQKFATGGSVTGGSVKGGVYGSVLVKIIVDEQTFYNDIEKTLNEARLELLQKESGLLLHMGVDPSIVSEVMAKYEELKRKLEPIDIPVSIDADVESLDAYRKRVGSLALENIELARTTKLAEQAQQELHDLMKDPVEFDFDDASFNDQITKDLEKIKKTRKELEDFGNTVVQPKLVITQENIRAEIEKVREARRQIEKEPITVPVEVEKNEVAEEAKKVAAEFEKTKSIMPIEGDTGPVTRSIEDIKRDINEKGAKISLGIELDRAYAKIEEARVKIEETSPTMPIKGNTEPVTRSIEDIRRDMNEKGVTIALGIELNKAYADVKDVQDKIAKEKAEMPLDVQANDLQAQLEVINKEIMARPGDYHLRLQKDKLIQQLNEVEKRLEKEITKVVKIKYVTEGPKPEGAYRGGLIGFTKGGLVPARVTHGEGFIPPEIASKNLGLLSRLNSGGTTSAVPYAISQFTGPKGVDRIPTYLPSGSYVLSNKGMEAYERSLDNGAQTFATGGEVGEASVGADESSFMMREDTGTKQYGTLTIVVEKDGKSKKFPIMGNPSVLKGLRQELEEERLTRLH